MTGLEITFISREQQKSAYDWADIVFHDVCVGKSRCRIGNNLLTIYSITIYPEFQGNGFGKAFVGAAKSRYATIVADRVRFMAIGFWESVGFVRDGLSENWIYTHNNTSGPSVHK